MNPGHGSLAMGQLLLLMKLVFVFQVSALSFIGNRGHVDSWYAINLLPGNSLPLGADTFDSSLGTAGEVECGSAQVLGARFPAWAVLGTGREHHFSAAFMFNVSSVKNRYASLFHVPGLSISLNIGTGSCMSC